MRKINQTDLKKGYIKYLIWCLETDDSFLKEKGVTLNALRASRKNFEKVGIKIDGTRLIYYNVFTEQTSSSPDTLNEIAATFRIKVNYDNFTFAVKSGNQKFAKFVYDSFGENEVPQDTTSTKSKKSKRAIIIQYLSNSIISFRALLIIIVVISAGLFIVIFFNKERDVSRNTSGLRTPIDAVLDTAQVLSNQMRAIGSTGWIFLGYYDYDPKVNRYIDADGPYFSIDKSAYGNPSRAKIIHIGDVLKINKPREVIIVNYQNTKAKNVFKKPLADLTKADETGVKLPAFTRVKVEDYSVDGYRTRPHAVWVRVRLE